MNYQIPLSKKKYLIGLMLIVGLIILGGIAAFTDQFHGVFYDDGKMFILGLTLVLIFSFLLVFVLIKMTKHTYGLIINEQGIQDNIAGLNYGLMKWEDIEGFGFKTHVMNKFIVVFLKDEDELLINVKGFKKTNLKFNKDTFGSPLAISTTMLKMKWADVEVLIREVAKEKNLEIF